MEEMWTRKMLIGQFWRQRVRIIFFLRNANITSMIDFIVSQKDETEMEPSCVVPPLYHFWFKEREKSKSGHFSVA